MFGNVMKQFGLAVILNVFTVINELWHLQQLRRVFVLGIASMLLWKVLFVCLFYCQTLQCTFCIGHSSARFQAPPLFQHPSLGGEHGAAVAFLQRRYFDNGSLELRHMEGGSHGNKIQHLSYSGKEHYSHLKTYPRTWLFF